jgi:hypothetical protein
VPHFADTGNFPHPYAYQKRRVDLSALPSVYVRSPRHPGGLVYEMTPTLREQLAALDAMSLGQLRETFLELTGESTTSKSKPHLRKRVAWWIQVRHFKEEDRVERIRKRGLELARLEDVRLTPPAARAKATKRVPIRSTADAKLPPPGTLLVRAYKGRDVCVTVLPNGFEHEGRVYASLSAIAKLVTGTHCSGIAWFGLTKRKDRAT